MKLAGNRDKFDEAVPTSGHESRFERRLEEAFGTQKKRFPWLKIAAGLIVLFSCAGLWFWTNQDNGFVEVADLQDEIPVKEAEQYYEQSFNSQFKMIASNYTSLESKSMIDESQLMIKELDENYKNLERELKETGDQRVAAAMINNYKSRIKILETLVQKLNYVNQLKQEKNENITI